MQRDDHPHYSSDSFWPAFLPTLTSLWASTLFTATHCTSMDHFILDRYRISNCAYAISTETSSVCSFRRSTRSQEKSTTVSIAKCFLGPYVVPVLCAFSDIMEICLIIPYLFPKTVLFLYLMSSKRGSNFMRRLNEDCILLAFS